MSQIARFIKKLGLRFPDYALSLDSTPEIIENMTALCITLEPNEPNDGSFWLRITRSKINHLNADSVALDSFVEDLQLQLIKHLSMGVAGAFNSLVGALLIKQPPGTTSPD